MIARDEIPSRGTNGSGGVPYQDLLAHAGIPRIGFNGPTRSAPRTSLGACSVSRRGATLPVPPAQDMEGCDVPKLLFVGDVVGRNGLDFACDVIPKLRADESIDWIVVNAENVEEGSGLTRNQFKRLKQAGVDGITLGDHIYRKREIMQTLEADETIVKPANMPPDAPGREWMLLESAEGRTLAVFALLGRVFMKPVDCPFRAADRVLGELESHRPDAVLVDFHAEATSDKQLMGRYLDGRVTAMLGTHTHVTTADECLLPGGTAFQCDVGMTGPHDGIIGRQFDRVLETTLTARPVTFLVAKGDLRLSGTIVELCAETNKATAIRRVCVRQEETNAR